MKVSIRNLLENSLLVHVLVDDGMKTIYSYEIARYKNAAGRFRVDIFLIYKLMLARYTATSDFCC